MIFIRKGIATETIFYIVIGIVVIGILSVLVYNYSRTARNTGDCATGEQRYCAWLEQEDAANGAGTVSESDQDTEWNRVRGTCGTASAEPSEASCRAKGYNV